MSDDVAIAVDDVWKRYGLPLPELYHRWRAWRLARRHRRLSSGGTSEDTLRDCAVDTGNWALRGVSFEVKHGETVGLIGRNGAGKSTLLKVLAGVTPGTRGSATVRGRVFSMIELNAGLHRELTGRENVRLLGAIMGLSRREVDARMPAIEAYCELEDWFDSPVWKYSSGMLARIGFGVAVNVDADVLLVDEVLAVGDLAFQRRCYDRIAQLRNAGVTILLVSHNMRQIERLCDRTILLDSGRVVACGETTRVVDQYFGSVMETEFNRAGSGGDGDGMRIQSDPGIELVTFDVVDESGRPCQEVRTGETVRFRAHIRSDTPLDSPVVAFGFVTSDLLLVTAIANEFDPTRKGLKGRDIRVECRIPSLHLLPGIYGIRIKARDRNSALLLSGQRGAALKVLAGGEGRFGLDTSGLVYTEAEWRHGTWT